MLIEGLVLPVFQSQDLASFKTILRTSNCKACELGSCYENNRPVVSRGSLTAPLMFIGEAPGASEAEEGLPFVGRAGKFLDEMLSEVGIKQEDIYISNTCRCRPLDNRAPTSKEAEKCIHYLLHEISLLKPKVIMCLGKTAAQYFLPEIKSSTQMKSIVGKRFAHPAFNDIAVFVTYHPAFLLRPGGQAHIAETKTHLAVARDYLIENGDIVGQVLQRNYMKVSVSIKPNAPFAKFQRII